MAREQAPPQSSASDEPAPESSNGVEVTRRPNGRFAPNHSGNPKGRPPKRKTSTRDELDRILDDPSPVNNPLFAGRSNREAMLLSMMIRGHTDWRAARAVLHLDLSLPASSASEAKDDVEDDFLKHYIERKARQEAIRDRKDKGDDPEDDENAP